MIDKILRFLFNRKQQYICSNLIIEQNRYFNVIYNQTDERLAKISLELDKIKNNIENYILPDSAYFSNF